MLREVVPEDPEEEPEDADEVLVEVLAILGEQRGLALAADALAGHNITILPGLALLQLLVRVLRHPLRRHGGRVAAALPQRSTARPGSRVVRGGVPGSPPD